MFIIEYEDGRKETYKNLDIDVVKVNRQKVKSFFFSESDKVIGLNVKEGNFYINGTKIPFAFNSESTEFVLFRRMQVTPTLSDIMKNTQTIPKIFAIGFGLRNTLSLPDGTTKNHVQLFWLFADGTVSIGGNK